MYYRTLKRIAEHMARLAGLILTGMSREEASSLALKQMTGPRSEDPCRK